MSQKERKRIDQTVLNSRIAEAQIVVQLIEFFLSPMEFDGVSARHQRQTVTGILGRFVPHVLHGFHTGCYFVNDILVFHFFPFFVSLA